MLSGGLDSFQADGVLPDLTDPGPWVRAQAGLAAPLADAAIALGALDAAVESAPWIVPRLALIEAEAMLWSQGIILRREEIGRDLMAARAGSDMQGLVQARWAVRRLCPGGDFDPSAPRVAPPGDLRAFLGLHRVARAGLDESLVQRPCGDDFDHAAQGFAQALAAMSGLHPLAQAGVALPLWRLAGLSPVEDVIEAGSFVTLHAARAMPCLPFTPLGRHGRKAWRAGGTAGQRLEAWLAALRDGARDARAELRRLERWSQDSLAAVARMKGDTPARLIGVALRSPLVGTEDCERHLNISRDSAERGLARLQQLGILREITGRGRFRLWTAAA